LKFILGRHDFTRAKLFPNPEYLIQSYRKSFSLLKMRLSTIYLF
jgi:hypothetical protein